MNTQRTILAIVGSLVLAGILGFVVLVVEVGLLTATFASIVGAVALSTLYRRIVRPWHLAWGASRLEVDGVMPGDELVPDGAATTRAITIEADRESVWPWLVQIGFGRAGWYSYDWIDNDGLPSTDRVIDDLQDLAVGDRIPMTPALGFTVVELDRPSCIVSVSDDGSTSWCLRLNALADGRCRLVSRFRVAPISTPLAIPWVLLSDPGAFIMERRMLKGIRDRAGLTRREARRAAFRRPRRWVSSR